jgi:hypothetical protein
MRAFHVHYVKQVGVPYLAKVAISLSVLSGEFLSKAYIFTFGYRGSMNIKIAITFVVMTLFIASAAANR